MKIFRHHVALPVLLLAVFESLFLVIALFALGFVGDCRACYFDKIAHLEFYEAILLAAAFSLICVAVGLYNRDCLLDLRVFVRRFILALHLVLIPTVGAVGFVQFASDGPFGWYVGVLSVAIAVFFLLIFLVRLVLFWRLDLPFLKKSVLVYGKGKLAENVLQLIANEASGHLRCVGHIANGRASQPHARGNLMVKPVSAPRPVSLALIAQSLRADEVVVACDDKRGMPVLELLECKLKGIEVTEYLTFWEREAGQIDINEVSPGWLALAEGFRVHLPRRAVKRIIDIGVSCLLIALFLPFALLVAVLIKLESSGPVFYKQDRVGLDGRSFRIWKFRSMRSDSESDGVPRWASEKDDRITRVGRFIRRTRIDEVPQVINVLLGDMSFIGPRPERPFFVEELTKEIPYYDMRHCVRPGITGWAQVNHTYGASVEDAKKKLTYDIYYVKNNDTLLDLAILAQTVRVILFAHGGR